MIGRKFKIIILALIFFLVGIIGFSVINETNKDIVMFTKNDIEKYFGIVLPPDAKVVHSYAESGIDSMARVIISMPAKEETAIIKLLGFDDEVFANENRYYLEPNDGSWNPSSIKVLPTAQKYGSHGQVVNLGYAIDNNTLMVYMMWHTL